MASALTRVGLDETRDNKDLCGERKLAAAVIRRAIADRKWIFFSPTNPLFVHWCNLLSADPRYLSKKVQNKKRGHPISEKLLRAPYTERVKSSSEGNR